MARGRRGRTAQLSPFDDDPFAGDPAAETGAAAGSPEEIVDEITWYMREHKVSRADLAAALGVPPGRVRRLLSGYERLTARMLARVARALRARLIVTSYAGADGHLELLPMHSAPASS